MMCDFDALLDSAVAEGRAQMAPDFVCIEVDAASPLDWIFTQAAGSRVLHLAGDSGEFIAGSGVAKACKVEAPSTTNEVEAILQTLEIPKGHPGWVGGTRFDIASQASAAWQPFGAARFVLPSKVFWKSEGRYYYGRHAHPKDGSFLAVSAELPCDESYEQHVEEALGALEAGLEKVVVAAAFRFDISINIEATLRALARAEPLATIFWLEAEQGGFFGATPERLYERRDDEVVVDALAGSAALGADAQKRLLSDDKELREHAHVRDFIKARLAQLGEVSCDDAPHTFELSSVQHLRTLVSVTLDAPGPVLSHLHPTPAVCGTPAEKALEAIRRIEHFDRGYYAGAIGRVMHEGERFNVALRCALYSADAVSLFGGAGIVEGSLAQNEAEEVNRKIKTLREALELR